MRLFPRPAFSPGGGSPTSRPAAPGLPADAVHLAAGIEAGNEKRRVCGASRSALRWRGSRSMPHSGSRPTTEKPLNACSGLTILPVRAPGALFPFPKNASPGARTGRLCTSCGAPGPLETESESAPEGREPGHTGTTRTGNGGNAPPSTSPAPPTPPSLGADAAACAPCCGSRVTFPPRTGPFEKRDSGVDC
jgi:hypothetical protein